MNKWWRIIISFIIFVSEYGGGVYSANILGFFPHPGKSHFDVFKVLMEELAFRGHNITVVSYFPHSNPPKGYNDISLEGLQEPYVHVISFEKFENPPTKLKDNMDNLGILYGMAEENCKAVLPSPQIQGLLSRKDFDLAIIEAFNTDCFLGVIHKLQVPFIGISSCTILPWHFARLGNPSNPSYIPNAFYGLEGNMNVLKRFYNAALQLVTTSLYSTKFDKMAQDLANRYTGDIPPLADIAKNTSLFLVNTHFSIHQPKPLVPALVEVGGLHVKPAKPLPKELDTFISEAEHGAILISFGSMLIPETMSQFKIKSILNACRRLPQRVIWKVNAQKVHLPDVPENVKIMDWLPQRDILGHKNVRAFVAHGGLLGLTEAIVSGTPVVAVPMFGDQRTNIRAAVRTGFAVKLEYKDITEESLYRALQRVLSEVHQSQALQVTSEFLDRPVQPLDLAVYWTEYILRHGGDRLRSDAVGQSFIAYHLIDIGITLILSVVLVIYAMAKLIQRLRRTVTHLRDKGKKSQ